MNIIKFYYACFEQQKRCCYNVAPSLACIKSKQSGEYTVLSARRFVTAHFHALAFIRPPIAIEASLVAGFRHMYGFLALQLGRP